jgi:hypothetical protein
MDWEKEAASSKGSAFGLLKSKSGRESIPAKSRNGQTKAMKMLGIGTPTVAHSQKSDENFRKEDDEEVPSGIAKSQKNPPPTKAFRQARRDAQRERERQILLRQQQQGGARSSADSEDVIPFPRQQRQHAFSREREPAPLIQQRLASQESKVSGARTDQSGSRPPSEDTRDRSSSDASSSRNPSKSPGFPYSQGVTAPAPPFTGRSRTDSNTGNSDSEQFHHIQDIHQLDMGLPPRRSPVEPYAVNSTPALSHNSPFGSGNNTPTTQGFQSQQGRLPANLKRNVNKSDISEPTFMSKTSHIMTVDLPVGASLQNGMPTAPPLPVQDPRRRQARTQAPFGNISRNGEPSPSSPMVNEGLSEEMSPHSTEGAEHLRMLRQNLRKSSSEGGNMNTRVRQVFAATPSPSVPSYPISNTRQGGMF